MSQEKQTQLKNIIEYDYINNHIDNYIKSFIFDLVDCEILISIYGKIYYLKLNSEIYCIRVSETNSEKVTVFKLNSLHLTNLHLEESLSSKERFIQMLFDNFYMKDKIPYYLDIFI